MNATTPTLTAPLVPLPAGVRNPNGLIARLALQCTHPESGQTGSWLFTCDSHRIAGTSVSPVFADTADLFLWAHANGWQQQDCTLNSAYVYRPQGGAR